MIWYDLILFAQNRDPTADYKVQYETRKKTQYDQKQS